MGKYDWRVDDLDILSKFTLDFCSVVEKHCKYFICSGFSAISTGRARGTEDIDIIIEKLDLAKFIILHNDLIKNKFECMQSESAKKIFEEYLSAGISVRYVRHGEILPEMELKFAKDELDEKQLKEASPMPQTGLPVKFAPLEGNIAFKEELLKSDKDLEDSRHLRILFEEDIDEELVNWYKEKIRRLRLE